MMRIQQLINDSLINSCEHPNIVHYIGFFGSDQLGPLGKELGLINIVMEFMGGKDLHGYLINEKIVWQSKAWFW